MRRQATASPPATNRRDAMATHRSHPRIPFAGSRVAASVALAGALLAWGHVLDGAIGWVSEDGRRLVLVPPGPDAYDPTRERAVALTPATTVSDEDGLPAPRTALSPGRLARVHLDPGAATPTARHVELVPTSPPVPPGLAE